MKSLYLGLASLIATTLSLTLPAVAQSKRYPTDAELQPLIQGMRQNIPQLVESGFYNDRRTESERQEVADFAAAWALVDPAIAPFLGEWTAIEESLYIFPGPVRGEVCIIDSYLEESEFYQGQVIDGKVYTDNNLVFVIDSGFLGNTFVVENYPGLYEYAHPRPLEHPANHYFAEYHPEIVAQFIQAGCLAERPE